jgi:hypothetical protein
MQDSKKSQIKRNLRNGGHRILIKLNNYDLGVVILCCVRTYIYPLISNSENAKGLAKKLTPLVQCRRRVSIFLNMCYY